MRTRARQPGHLLDDFLDVVRQGQPRAVAVEPGVLVVDGDADVARERVMRADDRADAVLQGGDDPAAVGVVLGIGREGHAQVELEADRVAADLDVALLQHVEQADLDLGRQVGQLVDAEDAPVGAGDQAEVHRQLAGEIAALGVLDHVDLADQVGDGDIRRGEFFMIAVGAADPGDRRLVAQLGHLVARVARDRGIRMVVDLGALDDRHGLVEQLDKLPQHAGLGLSAQAQKQHVVLGEKGVLDLGNDGVLVTEDIGEERLAPAQLGDEVAPHFRLHRFDLVAAGL